MTIVPPESKSGIKSASYWENYRHLYFPISKKWSYFDHAAVSPLCQPASDAIQRWNIQATEEGDTVWPQWAERVEQVRSTAAALVNAQATEIAFIPSTTFGISLVAEGLDWRKGDNVVLPTGEFPSNLYPWMHLQDKGVELREVETGEQGEIDLNKIASACDERTRLVSASWVGYASGYRVHPHELAQVAHDHGALFFLDAIQGLGVFPLDVRLADIDFFSADGHKWLMSPEGAGVFFCKEELLDQIRPRVVGWNSVKNSYDFSKVELTLKNSAARYEAGTQNMSGILAMGASLDLITEAGVCHHESSIGHRVIELTHTLAAAMSELGFDCQSHRRESDQDANLRFSNHSSGIIAFSKSGSDPTLLRSRLLENGVVTSVRNGFLRFSPHAYNNLADIDRTLEVLSET